MAAEECIGIECEPATFMARLLRGMLPVFVKEGDADTWRFNVCGRLL